jgi:oligopeptide transport system substrate-binding protein
MTTKKITRREFLHFAGMAAGAATLAACAPQVITQVVQTTQQVVVTQQQQVVQTKVVEQLVTPTNPPAFVTIQGRPLPADAAPLEKQILLGSGAEPSHLDVSRDLFTAAMVMHFGVEPLVALDENQEIVGAEAESWKVSQGATYTEFTLRKDIAWSDGVPLTSDDWIFTFQHALDPKLANPFGYFYGDIKGAAAYNAGTGPVTDLGVIKVDDRTFQIWGTNPAPHIPALMTYQGVVPCPKHKAESNPEHWADTMEGFVASGPFTLTKWDHNVQMVWQTHKYYNGPFKPGFQTVVQTIGTANTNWWNAWLNKEVDIAAGLAPDQLAQVRSNPDLNALLHWWPDPKTDYISFNVNTKPYDNKDFRMALAKSIDRVTWCQQVLNNAFLPAYSMLPPGFPAYNADLKSIQDFDVAAAKALLEKAGFKDGIDPATNKPFKLTWTTRVADGNYPQFVQQQWQTNLGIEVVLDNKENAVWRQMRTDHKLDVFHNFYEYDFMDPANLLATIWHNVPGPKGETNWGSSQLPWHNADFDKLCDQAGTEADPVKRLQLYQQAEKILVEDAGGIFLLWTLIFQTWWPYVTGFKPNKAGVVEYRYLDMAITYPYIRNDVDTFRKSTY